MPLRGGGSWTLDSCQKYMIDGLMDENPSLYVLTQSYTKQTYPSLVQAEHLQWSKDGLSVMLMEALFVHTLLKRVGVVAL
jgi:hypothetical protein